MAPDFARKPGRFGWWCMAAIAGAAVGAAPSSQALSAGTPPDSTAPQTQIIQRVAVAAKPSVTPDAQPQTRTRLSPARRILLAQAQNGANDELRALTDQVVKAIGGLKSNEENDAAADKSVKDIRASIMALVKRATEQGKSTDYVKALLDDALNKTPGAQVPPALAGPGGRIDVAALIASVVRQAAPEPAASSNDSYLAALENEGAHTVITQGGASAPAAAPAKPPPAATTAHTVRVQKGETLGQIAYRMYGDSLRYKLIYNANKDILESPDKIYSGMVLRVPALNSQKMPADDAASAATSEDVSGSLNAGSGSDQPVNRDLERKFFAFMQSRGIDVNALSKSERQKLFKSFLQWRAQNAE